MALQERSRADQADQADLALTESVSGQLPAQVPQDVARRSPRGDQLRRDAGEQLLEDLPTAGVQPVQVAALRHPTPVDADLWHRVPAPHAQCRGPYTLRGYFRAPEHNAKAFTPDGFYLTGDLMRLHPSGNYVVEGRKKDLINRGGEKISAEEVENLILAQPDVVNVACVPVPDEVLGERMCACVVLRPGAELELGELCDFLLAFEIAKHKLPERLELFDELPLSPIGKVSKKDLVAQVSGR